MKIHRIDIERDAVALTRPYAVAYESKDAVDMMFARIETDNGLVGFGAGTPCEKVTGEGFDASFQTLTDGRITELVGRDPRAIGTLVRLVREQLDKRPAAMACVELALWDLLGKSVEQPLVDVFGRVHAGLLTSITIGISSLEQTLEEAKEHIANGFLCLKIKIGN
ncbi:MAG: dipeptide epimerase, partial [Myxococcota bacterium]